MKDVTIKIEICQSSPGGDEECFELTTDGEYIRENGVCVISYTESELTGYDGKLTTFTISPESVVLRRAEGETGDMVFSETQKHHFLYETDYGSLTMGIDTSRIVRKLDDDGGALEIDYTIDVNNYIMSRNSFRINVNP